MEQLTNLRDDNKYDFPPDKGLLVTEEPQTYTWSECCDLLTGYKSHKQAVLRTGARQLDTLGVCLDRLLNLLRNDIFILYQRSAFQFDWISSNSA